MRLWNHVFKQYRLVKLWSGEEQGLESYLLTVQFKFPEKYLVLH
jgi:hypothetical protein